MKNAKALAALVLCGLLGSAMLYAQADRGAITGIVTDPQGAVIPDAEIQITNVNTGVATTVRTSGTGNYTTPPLIIGMYEMRLEQSGFQVFVAVGLRAHEAAPPHRVNDVRTPTVVVSRAED